MRLNLTNDEASDLLEAVEIAITKEGGTAALQMVAHKLEVAIAGLGERDEFHVGQVACKRMRGSEFSGYDRRNTSTTHFGWLLTHEPSGRKQELPPDRNSGITKRAAALFAGRFGKLCERECAKAEEASRA